MKRGQLKLKMIINKVGRDRKRAINNEIDQNENHKNETFHIITLWRKFNVIEHTLNIIENQKKKFWSVFTSNGTNLGGARFKIRKLTK
jgi:hypothetical protein